MANSAETPSRLDAATVKEEEGETHSDWSSSVSDDSRSLSDLNEDNVEEPFSFEEGDEDD